MGLLRGASGKSGANVVKEGVSLNSEVIVLKGRMRTQSFVVTRLKQATRKKAKSLTEIYRFLGFNEGFRLE